MAPFNFLENLRLKGIFAPPPGPFANDLPSQGGYGGNMSGPTQLPSSLGTPPMENTFATPEVPTPQGTLPVEKPLSALEAYKPETDAKTRLDTLLASYPERKKPGWLKAIAAGLAASATHRPQDIEPMLFGDYNRQLLDWKNKTSFAEKAADNENARNINSRTLAYQTAATQLREEAQAAKDKKDTAAAEAATKRANAYDYKARHPDAQFQAGKGGNLMVWNPDTRQFDDTGIDMGTMTEFDKLHFLHKGKMEEGAQRGNFQITVADRRADAAAENKGWQLYEMDDPDNPGKKIPVRINVNTGEKQPVEGLGSVQKIGTSKGMVQPANIKDIQAKAQKHLSVLSELLQGEGDKSKINPLYSQAVGSSRMLPLHWIPGSKGRTGESKIKRIKDLLTLDLIQELKAASKTGATGFGALNIKELGVLESAASNLDPTMDEPEFLEEMKTIREELRKILKPADGLNETKNDAPPLTAAQMIEKHRNKDKK